MRVLVEKHQLGKKAIREPGKEFFSLLNLSAFVVIILYFWFLWGNQGVVAKKN